MNAQLQIDQTPHSPAPHSEAPPLQLLPPPSIQPSPNATVQPAPPSPDTQSARKLSRNGKIARLPYFERDMVNRMVRNNIPHDKIREALEEHDIRVTVRNISNWKTRGAYQEWCAEQDRAVETRLLQDNLLEHLRKNDAADLSEIGLQLAATSLSQFFLQAGTQKPLATDPAKHAPTVSMICRLARQIHTLQKYRDESAKELGYKHNPERIKREHEKDVEITRGIYSAARLGQTIDEPDTPHRNYVPRTS